MATQRLGTSNRQTAAAWASANPIVGADVVVIETDTQLKKMGDGVTAYNSLPYTAGIKRTVYGSAAAASTITSTHQCSLGVKRVYYRGYGAGAGGGSGGVGTGAAAISTGGGGSGGAAFFEGWLDVASLPTDLTLGYQVAVGGAGGASRISGGSGNQGTNSSQTFVGSSLTQYLAGTLGSNSGGLGRSDSTVTGGGGGAGIAYGMYSQGGAGGASAATGGSAASGVSPVNQLRGAGGGGGGGGLTAAFAPGAGGAGSAATGMTAPSNGGVTVGPLNGSVGSAYLGPDNFPICGGQGGGGGAGSASAIGGTGGRGGFPGGGGGGGGAALNGNGGSGAGGQGGNAVIEIVEYFG